MVVRGWLSSNMVVRGWFYSNMVVRKGVTVVLHSCLWEACSAVVQYGGQEKGQPFVTVMRVWRPLPSSRVIWGEEGVRVLLNAATCTVVCCMVEYFLCPLHPGRDFIFVSIGLESLLLGRTFNLTPCRNWRMGWENRVFLRSGPWGHGVSASACKEVDQKWPENARVKVLWFWVWKRFGSESSFA